MIGGRQAIESGALLYRELVAVCRNLPLSASEVLIGEPRASAAISPLTTQRGIVLTAFQKATVPAVTFAAFVFTWM